MRSFDWQLGAERKGCMLVLHPSGWSGSKLPGEAWPPEGSSSHSVKQWLLGQGWFPAKWINLLFSVGGVKLDGERIVLAAFPPADTKADPMYLLAAAAPNGHPAAGEPSARPLYEDDYALVMDKPAGMPVHPARQGERGTLDEAAAKHLLQQGDPLPVRHIHRLDNETSGPVLYSKNELAQLRLDEAMRSKAIERIYVAFVHGKVARHSGVIDVPIGRDRHHPARRRAGAGGDSAVTHYEVAEQYRSGALVRLTLETGRTHQIRVHMSHIGHPLVGDSLYGGQTRQLAHQALHGERLLFAHPLDGRPIEVSSPYPAWFEQVRQSLQSR